MRPTHLLYWVVRWEVQLVPWWGKTLEVAMAQFLVPQSGERQAPPSEAIVEKNTGRIPFMLNVCPITTEAMMHMSIDIMIAAITMASEGTIAMREMTRIRTRLVMQRDVVIN